MHVLTPSGVGRLLWLVSSECGRLRQALGTRCGCSEKTGELHVNCEDTAIDLPVAWLVLSNPVLDE
jgi:hypothetical protein